MVIGTVDETFASCMMVHFWVNVFKNDNWCVSLVQSRETRDWFLAFIHDYTSPKFYLLFTSEMILL